MSDRRIEAAVDAAFAEFRATAPAHLPPRNVGAVRNRMLRRRRVRVAAVALLVVLGGATGLRTLEPRQVRPLPQGQPGPAMPPAAPATSEPFRSRSGDPPHALRHRRSGDGRSRRSRRSPGEHVVPSTRAGRGSGPLRR